MSVNKNKFGGWVKTGLLLLIAHCSTNTQDYILGQL
jgi:hypothetical protein